MSISSSGVHCSAHSIMPSTKEDIFEGCTSKEIPFCPSIRCLLRRDFISVDSRHNRSAPQAFSEAVPRRVICCLLLRCLHARRDWTRLMRSDCYCLRSKYSRPTWSRVKLCRWITNYGLLEITQTVLEFRTLLKRSSLLSDHLHINAHCKPSFRCRPSFCSYLSLLKPGRL